MEEKEILGQDFFKLYTNNKLNCLEQSRARCNWIYVVVRFNGRIRYRKSIVAPALLKYYEFSRCICYVKLRKFLEGNWFLRVSHGWLMPGINYLAAFRRLDMRAPPLGVCQWCLTNYGLLSLFKCSWSDRFYWNVVEKSEEEERRRRTLSGTWWLIIPSTFLFSQLVPHFHSSSFLCLLFEELFLFICLKFHLSLDDFIFTF